MCLKPFLGRHPDQKRFTHGCSLSFGLTHSCHRSPMGKKQHLRNRCKQDGLDSSGGWSEIGIATVSICFTILCMLSTICSVNNYSLGLHKYQLDFETVSQYYTLGSPIMYALVRYCPSYFVCPALPCIVFNLLTWLIDSNVRNLRSLNLMAAQKIKHHIKKILLGKT